MSRLTEWYEKQKRKFIIAEIVCFVLAAVVLSLNNGIADEILPEKMLFTEGELLEDGTAYIDGTAEFGGTFLEADTVELSKGAYKIHILYETDYDDNGFVVTANNTNYGVVNTDIGSDTSPISFKSYHTERTIHAWLKDSSSLHIQMRFCGAGYMEIQRIVVEKMPNYTPLFVLLLLGISFHVCYYEKKHYTEERRERRRLIRGGILLITVAASIPLMVDYLVQGTDMAFHLYRIQGIADGLRSGQFPVRIHPNWWNEFGYGTPLFYADFFLYIPAILTLLGYSLQAAYKCYIVVMHLLTAWISYQCFKKIVKDDYIALFGACLYTLNVYRLMDIYMRGAVGEFTALTFLPLIVMGIYCIKEKGWIYLALGMTGCIQSHILTCEMTVIFLVLFSLIFFKWVIQKEVFLNLCKSVGCTILWNLWFVVPLLNVYSGNYKVKSGATYVGAIQDRGAFPAELFKLFINGLVGDQSAANGISGEMGHSIGLALGLGLAVSFIIYYAYREKTWSLVKDSSSPFAPTVIVGVVTSIFSAIALGLSTNLFPYDKISGWGSFAKDIVGHIQFPWRFLGFASLFCTITVVCAVFVWKHIHGEKGQNGTLCMISLVILTFVGMSAFYHEILSRETVITENHEFLAVHKIMDQTEYLIDGTDMGDLDHAIIAGDSNIIIENVEKQYTNMEIQCENHGDMESYVDVPLFYYPCYRATDMDTGAVLPVDYGTNNRVRIILPAGYSGTCILKVRERTIWRLMEVVSFCSWICILGYALKKYRKN